MRANTVRLVRLMLPGHNPMSRGVDRLEGCSLIVTVALAMVLLPIMLMVGSLTYTRVVATAEQDARTHREVVATLVEDTPRIGGGESRHSRVRATWDTPSGPGKGWVLAEDGLEKGDTVSTWLDENGRPVTRPASPGEAALAGGVVAISGWLTAAGLLFMLHCGLKRLLDRRRYRDWGLEWARVEPRWRAEPL